jgi:hypothetical protein
MYCILVSIVLVMVTVILTLGILTFTSQLNTKNIVKFCFCVHYFCNFFVKMLRFVGFKRAILLSL